MRNRIFYQTKIAGVNFEGIVSADGPYLSGDLDGGVALGVSGLRQFQPPPGTKPIGQPFGWWVVKYVDEARIFLRDFDDAAIRRLSDEFGLVMLNDENPYSSDRARQDYFFTAPAWDGLRQWVTKHPRLAKANAGCDPYLPQWYDRAIAEAQAISG